MREANLSHSATSEQPEPDATIPLMDYLGICVVVRDSGTLDDVGVCHAPAPVHVGDLIAFEQGPPLRVTRVLPVPAGVTCVPVLAQRAVLAIASR